MSKELKPCPFCGGVPYINDELRAEDCICVQCQECFSESTPMETDAEAITAWNTRPSPWIEIKSEDDLPGRMTECVGDIDGGTQKLYYNEKGEWIDEFGNSLFQPTAYMPIPDPPKKG